MAFDSADLTLVSSSDDCTVKIWRLNPATLGPDSARASALPETEPQVTLRGHSGPVTALAIAADRIYSASLDQTIQIWALPPRDREPYAPYDAALRLQRLEGHTDAVWALAVLPLRAGNNVLLASASADGTVRIWVIGEGTPALKHNLRASDDPTAIPTSVAACPTDLRRVAAGYTDGAIRLFDLESGQQVLRLRADDSGAQVNAIIAHPTLPLLVSAHEDGYIRLFDLNTGACTHSLLAHGDGVTSIDLDGAGLALVSVGHDCSVRFWDILGTRKCIQEISAHRPKANEGILGVAYHATMPFVASAAADGTIRLYASEPIIAIR